MLQAAGMLISKGILAAGLLAGAAMGQDSMQGRKGWWMGATGQRAGAEWRSGAKERRAGSEDELL